MRTTIKVFIIIGMVFGCVLIFPIIVGIFALNKMEDAKSKKEIETMSILTLLFCSFIAGILMLILKESDFNRDNVAEESKKQNNKIDTYEELIKIKKLFDDQIIDEKTYVEKKEKYLNKL